MLRNARGGRPSRSRIRCSAKSFAIACRRHDSTRCISIWPTRSKRPATARKPITSASRCGASKPATAPGPSRCARPRGRALRLWEPVVAERLARAALEAGPEIEAAYVLGAALSDQNRAEDALDAFREARKLAGPDRLRAAIAADEAGVLSHQLGRLADAERVLSETLEQVRDPGARAVLEGGRAAIVVSSGHGMHGEPDAVTSVVPTAALAALIESATAGRLERAVAIAAEHLATAPQWTEEFPTIELYFHLARSWALILSGELGDAQVHAEVGYATALEENAEFPRGTWSFVRGVIHVARGRPHSATRALQEAASAFEIADRGFLRPSCTFLAMAAALEGDAAAGEQTSARRARRQAQLRRPVRHRPGACGRVGDRGTRGTVRGRRRSAARRRRLRPNEMHGRSRCTRSTTSLGSGRRQTWPIVSRRSTELVDGEFVQCVAAHARALVDDDGPALDAVAHSFSSLTFDLFAAEASAAAARAHRRAGKRASAFTSLERAHALVARCESARTPALEWADQPEDLTAREREIADLARADLTSREIAERLGITTRTVDNLLGRVYVKLGVSGRQELADDARTTGALERTLGVRRLCGFESAEAVVTGDGRAVHAPRVLGRHPRHRVEACASCPR